MLKNSQRAAHGAVLGAVSGSVLPAREFLLLFATLLTIVRNTLLCRHRFDVVREAELPARPHDRVHEFREVFAEGMVRRMECVCFVLIDAASWNGIRHFAPDVWM